MLDIVPVNVPKAADVLAGILREKILGGDLLEGVPLPNERDLGSQAGLSRASVREALRILEGEGLIATRIGRSSFRHLPRARPRCVTSCRRPTCALPPACCVRLACRSRRSPARW